MARLRRPPGGIHVVFDDGIEMVLDASEVRTGVAGLFLLAAAPFVHGWPRAVATLGGVVLLLPTTASVTFGLSLRALARWATAAEARGDLTMPPDVELRNSSGPCPPKP